MDLNNFSFLIPKYLVSSYPYHNRTTCRLLSIHGNTGLIRHEIFFNILDQCNSGDVLVLNNTRVIPARLFGFQNNKKIECLVEKIINEKSILVQICHSKSIILGTKIVFQKYEIFEGHVVSKQGIFFIIFFDYSDSIFNILNKIGHIPLPPYINRMDESLDVNAYQTVYSKFLGSIASPTAGLHFDKKLLNLLCKKGIKVCFITLHIGYGTFQPIRSKIIEKHNIHSEYVEVSKHVVKLVNQCKQEGKRVIAVGTSTLRALESAKIDYFNNNIKPICKYTKIFIIPGYNHTIVDVLITNFHTSKSTLILLVVSFLGYVNTMNAYNLAIKNKYRFFSYGDAMFITKKSLLNYKNK
ncbi:S-adenosylmethionine:tRNA ribosyltransferase-isomerase [Buchnera aphidicola (Phyllaphis fagi)]|uniref:tRNA preQ1(34) S-adenosylmethionine ribosyltransferase-isomerase QueA n=1 Tax=Buchnera aphidicola TaxID=9 RepID=UPI003464D9A7